MSENTDADAATRREALGGKRVVLTVYLVVVSVTALFGVLIGYYGGGALQPIELGFITIPPSPLGFALYGVVTVGGTLGLLLALITYVSARERERA